MINIEEILVKLGFDGNKFDEGLKSRLEKTKEWSKEVVATFAAPFAGALGAEKLYESTREVIEFGKQIRSVAESAGVSTDFLQGFQVVAQKVGVNSESANKALEILARKIGEAREQGGEAEKVFEKWGISLRGLSDEDVVFKIADTMKHMEDPAQRTALAFDLMGKSAGQLSAALSMGADKLKEALAEAPKLTDAELAKLDTISEKLEEMGKKWKIFWGGQLTAGMTTPAKDITEKQIADMQRKLAREQGMNVPDNLTVPGLRDAAIAAIQEQRKKEAKESLKKLDTDSLSQHERGLSKQASDYRAATNLKEVSTAERLVLLHKQLVTLHLEIGRNKELGVGYGEYDLELAKTEREIADAKKKLSEETLENSKKQNEALNSRLSLLKREVQEAEHLKYLLKERDEEKFAAYIPTLEELANSGKWGPFHRFQQGPFAQNARDIMAGEGRAKQDLIYGDKEGALEEINKVNELKNVLRDAGVMTPDMRLQSIDEQIKTVATNLSALMGGKPINVKPANGA